MNEPAPYSNTKYTHMQDQPLVKEKVRRTATTIFMEKFEKMSIEDKEKVLSQLGNLFDKHRMKEISELESRISKLGGGAKQGNVNKEPGEQKY